MYKTKYALLHHSRTDTNAYIGIGSTCMFKGNFDGTTIIKTRLAQSVEHWATNPKVVGNFDSNGEKELFILYFVAFDALQAGRLAPYKRNHE